MENKMDYIIKYKNEKLKIKKKYKMKIMSYLMFVVLFITLAFSIFSLVFLVSDIMDTCIFSFLLFIFLFGFWGTHHCYISFDNNTLKIKKYIESYNIPIEDLLNVDIEKDKYTESIKIQYIKNNKIKTIKIFIKSYVYTRANNFTFQEDEIKKFLDIFKTGKECLEQNLDGEYITINRKYSQEEIKQMLNNDIGKNKPNLPDNISIALVISLLVLIPSIIYCITIILDFEIK